MKSFDDIYRAYEETNAVLLRKESDARNDRTKEKWKKRRRLNDQAYFVMLFTEIEDHVDRRCRDLIARKKKSKRWSDRRVWEIIKLSIKENKTETNLSFMERIALLAEKSGSDYARLKYYYDIRCKIAHGKTASVAPINIPDEAQKMKDLTKRLKS